MGFYVTCNWCGESIDVDKDYAKVPVEIERRKASRGILDREWAKEVRPTMHFHINARENRDRMGIEAEWKDDPDCCYMHAMAVINGRETETPDMGMEWRLVSVGNEADEVQPRRGRGGANAASSNPAPVPVQADDDLEAFLFTLAPSARHGLFRAFERQGISTLEQLEAMTDDELMALEKVGWTTRCKIRSFIAARKRLSRSS